MSDDENTQDEAKTEEPVRESPFKQLCHDLREDIGKKVGAARNLLKHGRFDGEEAYEGQFAEMKANAMLALRHLEDARMRIGKVLQAGDDGVSSFDKL